MVDKIRTWPPSARLVAAALLTLALIGTGIASLAVLNDQLIVRNTFATASIDLQGNSQQSIDFTFPIAFNATPYEAFFAIDVSNEGSAELRYSANGTAVFTPPTSNGWASVGFNIYSVPNQAACATGVTGPIAAGTVDAVSFGSSTTGQQAGDRLLAAGASEWLCLRAAHTNPVMGPTDSAVQTLTFSAESTGL